MHPKFGSCSTWRQKPATQLWPMNNMYVTLLLFIEKEVSNTEFLPSSLLYLLHKRTYRTHRFKSQVKSRVVMCIRSTFHPMLSPHGPGSITPQALWATLPMTPRVFRPTGENFATWYWSENWWLENLGFIFYLVSIAQVRFLLPIWIGLTINSACSQLYLERSIVEGHSAQRQWFRGEIVVEQHPYLSTH